jgi:hypothetical protein
MKIRVQIQGGVVKTKSHLSATPSAGRKYHAGYRRNLMGEGVIVAVELIVGHIIDAGDGHSISRLEFVFDVRRRGANRGLIAPLVCGELPRGNGCRAGGQGSVEEAAPIHRRTTTDRKRRRWFILLLHHVDLAFSPDFPMTNGRLPPAHRG